MREGRQVLALPDLLSVTDGGLDARDQMVEHLSLCLETLRDAAHDADIHALETHHDSMSVSSAAGARAPHLLVRLSGSRRCAARWRC